jgi:hypothetical protein
VELLIGLDNKQWLPVHVEDSWDPDDDMRLMRSESGHRYMITDGWGRDLLPPDNAPGSQAGAQGGAAEQEDAVQEVQLPEYKGWSQGTGNPGNSSGSGVTAQRGGCLGARPKVRGVAPSQVTPPTWGRVAQGGRPRGPSKEPRDPPTWQVRFGAAHPQTSRGARPRLRMVPPPRRRPALSPPPASGRGPWSWLGSVRGGRGQRGASRGQPPHRPPSPDPGRAQGPLQLMGPGDHPMQKLALMMAVMILGMSPAHGCSIGADPGSQGVRDQAEMMLPPSTWSSDDGKALMTEDIISLTTARRCPPVEPGGHSIGRILQQIQLGVESLVRIKNEVLRIGQETVKDNPEAREYSPGLGKSSQESRPKREAPQKAMDALKRGADATRGRGRRKGRVYQRAGIRN